MLIATPESRAAERTSVMNVSYPDCNSIMKRKGLTIVLRPPREIAPTNNVLEDKSDNRPRDVVDRGRWRNCARAREDDGETVINNIRN